MKPPPNKPKGVSKSAWARHLKISARRVRPKRVVVDIYKL